MLFKSNKNNLYSRCVESLDIYLVFFSKVVVVSILTISSQALALEACVNLFSDEISVKEALEQQALSDTEEIRAHLSRVNARANRQGALFSRLLDRISRYFMNKNGHSYFFKYMREGFPQRIRQWVKNSPNRNSIEQEIERMINRYKEYPEDVERYIFRTAAIRIESDILQRAVDANEFPATLEIPVALEDRVRVIFETRTYANSEEITDDLNDLVFRRESDRFGSDFTEGAFLLGRHNEQAQAKRHLEIILQELQKFPMAFYDAAKRKDYMDRLKSLLSNPALTPPGVEDFRESRQIIVNEINFFYGSDTRYDGGANDGLFTNDKVDLSIDQQRMSLWTSLWRRLFLTLPLSVPLASVTIATVNDGVNYYLQTQFLEEMHIAEIVLLPEEDFREAALKLLTEKYGVRFENGTLILPTQEAKDALAHINEARQEYIDEAQEHRTNIEELGRALGDELELPEE